MNRKEKEKLVQTLKKKMNERELVGIVNMHKLPAKQLQEIREGLRERAEIKMAKKTLIKMALEGSEKSLEKLKEYLQEEPALLFSDQNPFKLYSYLKENKSEAAAKPGDEIQKDVIIQATKTDLDPGPAISQLQAVGLETTVEEGKISIQKDKKIIEEGETVDEDIATVLNMLGEKPMEIGLNLVVVFEDGEVYPKEILDLDKDEYRSNIEICATRAKNLSVESGFLTKETVSIAIQQAFMKAENLTREANIFTPKGIEEMISLASHHQRNIENIIEEVN